MAHTDRHRTADTRLRLDDLSGPWFAVSASSVWPGQVWLCNFAALQLSPVVLFLQLSPHEIPRPGRFDRPLANRNAADPPGSSKWRRRANLADYPGVGCRAAWRWGSGPSIPGPGFLFFFLAFTPIFAFVSWHACARAVDDRGCARVKRGLPFLRGGRKWEDENGTECLR